MAKQSHDTPDTDASAPDSAPSQTPEETAQSRLGERAAWAQDVATQQAQYLLVATTNFLTTMTTLLISAMGLVTALAWNRAISDWLPTVKALEFRDPLVRDFAYAVGATLIAVLTITVLTIVNARLRKGQVVLVREKQA